MKVPDLPPKNLVQALSCVASLFLPLTYAQEVSMLGTIADGTPSPLSPPKVLPKLNVEATTLQRLAGHDVIMQRVTDPGLPDPPPPPPPMSEKEYEALRASEKWKEVEGMAPMLRIHQLYTVEKSRLAAAYVGRECARVEREAYLKAHPPITPDTVIQLWSRKSKQSGAANIQTQEEAQ